MRGSGRRRVHMLWAWQLFATRALARVLTHGCCRAAAGCRAAAPLADAVADAVRGTPGVVLWHRAGC
jgi:hypothetical protein